jgi:hypothetical protein
LPLTRLWLNRLSWAPSAMSTPPMG